MTRILAGIALLFAAPTSAATLPATPATFASVFVGAAAGDTVQLAPGNYGAVYLRGNLARQWTTPVQIDASDTAAIFTSLRLDGFSGVTIKGFKSDHAPLGGLVISDGSSFQVLGTLCTNATRACIELGNVSDATITDTEVVGSGSDGVDCAGCQNLTILRLACYGSTPTLGAHPDCAQIYSAAGQRPTINVTLRSGVAVGDTQGFDMFGNVVPAVNVVFDTLTVMTRYPQGIAMTNCTGATGLPCAPTNSRVEYLRGAPHIVQMPAGPTDSGNSARPQ